MQHYLQYWLAVFTSQIKSYCTDLHIVFIVTSFIILVFWFYLCVNSKRCKLRKIVSFVEAGYYSILLTITIFSRKFGVVHSSLKDIWATYKALSVSDSVYLRLEIILNVLVFIPHGLIVTKRSKNNLKISVLFIMVLPIIIEIVQMLLECGLFEICDLFENIIGGVLGMVCILCVSRHVIR